MGKVRIRWPYRSGSSQKRTDQRLRDPFHPLLPFKQPSVKVVSAWTVEGTLILLHGTAILFHWHAASFGKETALS